MDISILIAFLGILFVALLSFIGFLFFKLKPESLRKVLLVLVSFSAGALIGDVFFHLLPEALANNPENPAIWLSVII